MSEAQGEIVRQQVSHLLDKNPAYRRLDPRTREQLRADMSKIASFLAGAPASPLATQLAPQDPRQPGRPAGSQPGGAPSQPSATGRVGEVTRATLNAIDFPSFVASLIQGTFQAIVDSSIQQMEAYAELVRNITRTVDSFMQENVTPGMARDYLADQYGGLLQRDASVGEPRLTVNPNRPADGEMPSFFRELGFDTPDDLDDQALEEVVVPATRKSMAEQRQQLLATMVLMGINRVVVDDGEIMAKLQFHIDASETAQIRFDQTKTTIGNVARTAGRSPFTANGIMVNTTSLNAQSDINVRADLTGQVKVRFRSETFPLERFADSAAIQLINSTARVPQPVPQPGAAAAPAAPTAPGPAPQSLGSAIASAQPASDPWASRSNK